MDVGIDLILRKIRLRPVEDPSFIRAGGDTVPAPDAPVVVDNDNSIRLLPCGMNRAYLHAGRFLTLLALDGDVDESFLRDRFGIIVMLGVFEIDQASPLEPDDPDPVELAIVSGIVILLGAGIDTSSSADTSRKLKPITPEGFGKGFLSADLKLLPV